MEIDNFNVRVYGICFNNEDALLISKENYQNQVLIKFIGGGLEKGEGLHEALKREFKEELNIEIEVGDLIYINDFFQPSAFVKSDQIISVFYRVHLSKDIAFKTIKPINSHTLSWHQLSSIPKDYFTFKIENIVLDILKKT